MAHLTGVRSVGSRDARSGAYAIKGRLQISQRRVGQRLDPADRVLGGDQLFRSITPQHRHRAGATNTHPRASRGLAGVVPHVEWCK